MRNLLASAVFFFIIVAGSMLRAQSLTTGSGANGASPTLAVRHVIGLENISSQKSGKLSVQSQAMQFDGGKQPVRVPAASIEGVYVGSETTQSGGKVGRGVKTAS